MWTCLCLHIAAQLLTKPGFQQIVNKAKIPPVHCICPWCLSVFCFGLFISPPTPPSVSFFFCALNSTSSVLSCHLSINLTVFYPVLALLLISCQGFLPAFYLQRLVLEQVKRLYSSWPPSDHSLSVLWEVLFCSE